MDGILSKLRSLGLRNDLIHSIYSQDVDVFQRITGIPAIQRWSGICEVKHINEVNALIALVQSKSVPIPDFNSNSLLDSEGADTLFFEILNELIPQSDLFWEIVFDRMKSKRLAALKLKRNERLNPDEFSAYCEKGHAAIFITLAAVFELSTKKNENACEALFSLTRHYLSAVQIFLECKTNSLPFINKWSLCMKRRFPELEGSHGIRPRDEYIGVVQDAAMNELDTALHLSLKTGNSEFQNIIVQTIKGIPSFA